MVAHSEILLSKCAQFRKQGEFIDVRLKVAEDLFPAHRIVLAANSDYFHAMFAHGMKESNQEVIELKDENISVAALKIIMDSIYSGQLHVNVENVFEVLLAADHLQVASVVQQCCDYLQTEFVEIRFDVQTYCRICTIAERHGLTDLQEAAQRQMAFMYKEICESEEFLSHIDADQLSNLLSREDLSAPSEDFVFKSVMQWIKYKKEERMPVAATVIGAVRLGLVDITEVVKELNIEEMQLVPEIHMLLFESLLHNCVPSNVSKFAQEKAKLRSFVPVLIAVLPKTQLSYFDVENKVWKQLTPIVEAGSCYCVEPAGSKLYIAGSGEYFCYDIERNAWERHPHPCGVIRTLCIVGDYMYSITGNCNETPYRYSFAKRHWQSFAKVQISRDSFNHFYHNGALVYSSQIYVLYGHISKSAGSSWLSENAVLLCFDPVSNAWKRKASTCQPHFGSSLFVVNGKLHVAGGNVFVDVTRGSPSGKPASVEVYDETTNTWSIVEQKHIPKNSLNAVEVQGKVFFIINKFPVDSGIRILPGEVYPVYLEEWEKLTKVSKDALLCYMPVKKENLKTEEG